MRRTLIALAVVFGPATLAAAPAPADKAAGAAPVSRESLRAAALEYRIDLFQVTDTIAQNYVRPVKRADLVTAALTGLYEAAGVPVPAGLAERVTKADKDAKLLAALVTDARATLGNPEALQGNKAILTSCRAMTRALDPFCAVVTGEEAARNDGYEQNYGLGIDFLDKLDDGPLIIRAVVPGGPAQRAGLRPGDRVTHVNGKETKKLSTEQALILLNSGDDALARTGFTENGPPPVGVPEVPGVPAPARPVRLTLARPGEKEARKASLLPESFEAETVQGVRRNEDNSWDYWLDRKQRVAHVRIATLARHTASELGRVLARLDTGAGLRGLVLDLRWCPGGYLDPSLEAAGLFLDDGGWLLDDGVIARIKYRDGREQVKRASDGRFLRFPMVVLVNAETSGGAELIAAALQDHGRAAVVGQRTRGKASIQTQTNVFLGQGRGGNLTRLQLRLTNGTFLRPSGKNLNRFGDSKRADDWGVRPDAGQDYRVTADLGARLKEWWGEQTLRPGASTKALPLDDPALDPQRQAALKALRKRMGEGK